MEQTKTFKPPSSELASRYALQEGPEAVGRLDVQSAILKKETIKALKEATKIQTLTGLTLADFGCGTSSVYNDILEFIGPQGRYIGIDGSENQIAYCRQHHPDTNYIVGDETHPEVLSILSTVDILFMRLVVMHQKDPKAFLMELYKTMKPGALLIIQEHEDSEARKKEMLKKYPHSGALCDFKIELGKKLGLDYNFAKHLKPFFESLDVQKLIHKSEHVYLPMTEAKPFLKQTILELSKNPLNEMSDQTTQNYLNIIEGFPASETDFWNLDLHHTLIAQKA